ncbi:hypothetical protein M3Y99_00442500 [Aphelenchoides fujianensis]|nr:hypothetical protein M3Y99_00442500 [Aphelenchoides fujianensis]
MSEFDVLAPAASPLGRLLSVEQLDEEIFRSDLSWLAALAQSTLRPPARMNAAWILLVVLLVAVLLAVAAGLFAVVYSRLNRRKTREHERPSVQLLTDE